MLLEFFGVDEKIIEALAEISPTVVIVEALLAYAATTIIYEVGAMIIHEVKRRREERK